MAQRLSTGLVIAGAYADKVRRTLFAQAKGLGVDAREVVRAAAELNRVLFKILVESLKLDKGDVVRVRIEYDVRDGRIVWDYRSLQVEAFRRVPDEEVQRKVEETVGNLSEVLSAPVSEAEREVVGEQAEEVRRGEAERHVEELEIGEASFLGENKAGEKIIVLKNPQGRTIGVAALVSVEGRAHVDAIVVESRGGEAKRILAELEGEFESLEDVSRLKEVLKRGRVSVIDKEEARRIVTEKLEGLF